MADYLSEEEQLDRLKNWWQKNGTSLLVAIVLAVGGLGGWRWYEAEKTVELEAASDLFESFLAATDDARSELAESLKAEYDGTSYTTFVLLHQAREAVDAGDLEAAIATLRQVTGDAAHPFVADIARIRLARLLQQQDDTEAALATLESVEHQGLRAPVLELKGDIHLAAGERALAHEAYVAALAEIAEEELRPILRFKVDDTAPPQVSP